MLASKLMLMFCLNGAVAGGAEAGGRGLTSDVGGVQSLMFKGMSWGSLCSEVQGITGNGHMGTLHMDGENDRYR